MEISYFVHVNNKRQARFIYLSYDLRSETTPTAEVNSP
jgi:hypothetical protein